jgi:hypothetical protein
MQPHSHFTTLLLTFMALFSIVNPFSGAFISSARLAIVSRRRLGLPIGRSQLVDRAIRRYDCAPPAENYALLSDDTPPSSCSIAMDPETPASTA